MLKAKKLWNPLSTILARSRALSSATCRLPPATNTNNNTSQTHFSTPMENSGFLLSATSAYQFPGMYLLQLSRKVKNFSSESAVKTDAKCWNCNAEPNRQPFLVCEACKSVQPVHHSVDYFQIFGLEKKYEIEKDGNLEGKYKDWQKKLHPDLVHSKSEKEREFAAEQSARVIDAYRTLSNPRIRATYILKLEGVDVDEEETISEPQLLAEIMEIREAVEEAPDSQTLNAIRSQMQEKLQHWSNSFANAFRSCKFEEAITCIQRMTYYDRVNEEIVKRL